MAVSVREQTELIRRFLPADKHRAPPIDRTAALGSTVTSSTIDNGAPAGQQLTLNAKTAAVLYPCMTVVEKLAQLCNAIAEYGLCF